MKQFRRGLAALVVALALAIPAPAAQVPVQFFLGAEGDSLTQELVVRMEGEDGTLEPPLDFATPVNRLPQGERAYFLPTGEGTWVTMDYLLDPDGDGVYRMADCPPDHCAGDSLTPEGGLTPWGEGPVFLPVGGGIPLDHQTLLEGGRAYLVRRGLDTGKDPYTALLFLVTVHQGEESDCFYLRLYPRELPALTAARCEDIEPGSPYYAAVDYALSRGLMSGTGPDTFHPGQEMTRAMLAQILYAIQGKPASAPEEYTDVADVAWYAAAAGWAAEEGIMNGVEEGKFGPEVKLARQQLALILFKHTEGAGQPGTPLDGYADGASCAQWARPAMEWAAANGLMPSGEGNTLNPNAPVSRGEFAWILQQVQLLTGEI